MTKPILDWNRIPIEFLYIKDTRSRFDKIKQILPQTHKYFQFSIIGTLYRFGAGFALFCGICFISLWG